MENVFVIQTNDDNFKRFLNQFLSKHCKENNVNAMVYEMSGKGAEKVMRIINEKVMKGRDNI